MNRSGSNNNNNISKSVNITTGERIAPTQSYPSLTNETTGEVEESRAKATTKTVVAVTTANTTVTRTLSLRPFSTPKADLLKPDRQHQQQTIGGGIEIDPIILTKPSQEDNGNTNSKSKHEAETNSTADLFQDMKFQEITTDAGTADLDSKEHINKRITRVEVVGRERHRLRRSCSNLSQLVVEDGVVLDEKPSGIISNNKNGVSAIKQMGELSMMKDFTALSSKELKSSYLMRPCPRSYGMVRCYVKRTRSVANSFLPKYSVFLKEDDVELMSSKKRPYKATSNYVIQMDPTGDILGKIRSNILSSEYTVYDCRSPCRQQQQQSDQRQSEKDAEGGVRAELGAVIYRKVPSYAVTTASSFPPRKMQVCINSVGGGSDASTLQSYKPKTKAEEMLKLLKYKLDSAKRNFSVLESMTPHWDDKLEAYVLNFGGRVTMESEKNFQLVQANSVEEQIVVLQFGRVAKDEFTMDFQWPLSPFLAFALSLTACDCKVGRD